jgi:hypothetical protein
LGAKKQRTCIEGKLLVEYLIQRLRERSLHSNRKQIKSKLGGIFFISPQSPERDSEEMVGTQSPLRETEGGKRKKGKRLNKD